LRQGGLRSKKHYMKPAAQPVSLRLDAQLMRKAAAFARRRKVGVTTALRMIISEHLEGAEAAAELDAAARWQREQAWAALEGWERDPSEPQSIDQLRKAHQEAMRKPRRR
jgi:hypothetical protein